MLTATQVRLTASIVAVLAAISCDPQQETDRKPKLVGSAACATCHAPEHASWRRSQHAAAMQEARPETVLAKFDGSAFTNAGVTSKFFRRGDRFLVNTEGADGQLHDFEIRYTFGVYPLQQYLVAFPDGRMQPLPLAWDSRPATEGGQRWFHLSPGPRVTHTDELHWAGRQQNWNFMCADCHSTGVRKGYDAASDRFKTTWSEINVGCEACHGPASRHVKWAGYPKLVRRLLWRDDGLAGKLTERRGVNWSIDSTTGNALRSSPRNTNREIESCATCHSRRVQIADGYTAGAPLLDYYEPSLIVKGLYHPDGQQRDEVYTYVSFLQSRMNHAGVTCADCHEPHTQQLRAPGNAVCAQCHIAKKYDAPAHTLHPAGAPGSACVSCHMPATTYMQIDQRLDHSIRIPRPDLTVSDGVPNSCNVCHTDKSAKWAASQVASHYKSQWAGFQRFTHAFSADDRNAPGADHSLAAVASDSTEPAVVRASALTRLGAHPGDVALASSRAAMSDSSALVRRSALGILDAYPPQQRLGIAAPLLRDPSRAVRIEAARIMAPAASSLGDDGQRNAFSRAASEFVASQRLQTDRPENRTALGIFFGQLGNSGQAVAEYKSALRLTPGYGPAYVNLADVLRAERRDADADTVLRAGIGALPRDATLHHALGLLLIRSGKLSQALSELRQAALLAPDEPHFAYVYAVALHSAGRNGEAVTVLNQALERHPGDKELMLGLTTFKRDR